MGKMIIQEILKDLDNKIIKLEKISEKREEFTYCFRGEARDYNKTALIPTLFREQSILGKFSDKELINLITDYNISEISQNSPLEKTIEGQHYLALSRLLDVTFSILPSIFFAASGAFDEDGYVYVFRFPKTFSPSSTYMNSYYEKLINKQVTPYFQNFKVLSHTQSNDRIKSQSGGFILFPGSQLKKIPAAYYEKIKIKSEYKKKIMIELDKFFNINESTIYPEKSNKRHLIRQRLKSTYVDVTNFNNQEDFYDYEIEESLERVEFEVRCMLSDSKDKELLRFLRKEERDLTSYVKSLDKIATEKKVLLENKVRSHYFELSKSIKIMLRK